MQFIVFKLRSRVLKTCTCFCALFQALQIIDPSGVILEAVGVPIQNYLVQRTDAIKTMIQILAEAAKESDEFGGLPKLHVLPHRPQRNL